MFPRQHDIDYNAQGVLKAAKRECCSVASLADFCRSPCIFPAAENLRSTPPVEAGAARYCLAILHRLGQRVSLPCQYLSVLRSRSSSSGSPKYWSS